MADFILSELYKGRVKIKFYPVSHQYWISVDGSPFKRKSGVTTYIGIKDKSKPLGIWQQQMTVGKLLEFIEQGIEIDTDKAIEACIQHELYLKEAADIGSEAHEWFEAYIRNKLKQPGFENLPEIPKFPEAVTAVNAFMEWEKKNKIQFVTTEEIRYSLEHDYVGIEDLTLMSDGKLMDGDFKTSNGLYNSVRTQVAAYAMARMEEATYSGKTKQKSHGRWAIRLSKYSEEEYYKREELKNNIKKHIARIKGKEYKEYPPKPYQVFEAKFLDNTKGRMEDDFDAFLNHKKIFEWDKRTDSFTVGEDW